MQIGLLSEDNVERIPLAYKLFKSTSKSDEALASGFKARFSREVPIDFVGVWYVASCIKLPCLRPRPHTS